MTDKLEDRFFEEPSYTILAKLRQKARDRGRRLTYDCLSALVEGTKVSCKKGHRLLGKRNVVMSLLSVLRGWSSKQCKNCPDYDCEDNLKE